MALGPGIARWPLLPRLWRWKAHALELALFIGAYLVYRFTRGVGPSDLETAALGNAELVIGLERSLGIFWEPGWQAWAIDASKALVGFFNWVYIITYWPIILATALVVYGFDRRRYYHYRSVVMISLAGALVVFALFPLAPPRSIGAPEYFVDTIRVFGPSSYGSPAMSAYYNAYAAMPSLHFGWTTVLAVLFLSTLRGWLKVFGVFYPVLTFFAITITGNHYILDAVAGGLLAAMAFAVMELGIRRRLFLPQWWRCPLRGLSGRYWADVPREDRGEEGNTRIRL
jgi:hypothetical protein